MVTEDPERPGGASGHKWVARAGRPRATSKRPDRRHCGAQPAFFPPCTTRSARSAGGSPGGVRGRSRSASQTPHFARTCEADDDPPFAATDNRKTAGRAGRRGWSPGRSGQPAAPGGSGPPASSTGRRCGSRRRGSRITCLPSRTSLTSWTSLKKLERNRNEESGRQAWRSARSWGSRDPCSTKGHQGLNSGCRWHRWDPHVHAPGTVLNDQFKVENAWERYLKAIEEATPPIRVIGVTDYYSTDCYERVVAAKGSRPPGRLLLRLPERRDAAGDRNGERSAAQRPPAGQPGRSRSRRRTETVPEPPDLPGPRRYVLLKRS